MTKSLKKIGSVEAYVKQLLDSNHNFDINIAKRAGWNCIPVCREFDYYYAEWVAVAAKQIFGARYLMGFCFEFGKNYNYSKIPVTTEKLLGYIGSNSHLYVIISDAESNFLLYLDQFRRYFLVCGPQNFVEIAPPVSSSVAKKDYFHQFTESLTFTTEEKEYLTNIWQKYSLRRAG